MAADVASADAERKADSDTRPKAVEEPAPAPAATPTAPTAAPGAAGLGAQQVQAKSASGNAAVGAADDDAERRADETADTVMRMPEPAAPGPAPTTGGGPAPAPAAPAAPGTADGVAPPAGAAPGEVRRAPDPAADQRLPAAAPGAPAGDGAAGARPDTTTPAGPTAGGQSPAGPAGAGGAPAASGPAVATPGGTAPLVGPPAGAPGAAGGAAGPGSPTAGTTAPPAEPPAPEGEAPARETPRVSDDVQTYLDASRGKGAPLPDGPRAGFEARFQRPFDDVRVHDDARADDAARKLDALAFTRGNDIYFRAGAYDPTSAAGKRLLAHELAHVVQQRPGVNRKVSPGLGGATIRRGGGGGTKKGGTAGKKDTKNKLGEIDVGAKKLHLEKLPLPAIKVEPHNEKSPLTWTKEERSGAHADNWLKAAKPALAGPVKKRAEKLKLEEGEPLYLQIDPNTAEEKKPKRGPKPAELLFVGSPEDIAGVLTTLPWNRKGSLLPHQIDHRVELQLGGKDDIDNLWLLDASVNASAGGTIKGSVRREINAFLEQAKKDGELEKVPTFGEIDGWRGTKGAGGITFGKAVPDKRSGDDAPIAVQEGKGASTWTIKQLEKAIMDPLAKMTPANRKKAKGSEELISLFSKPGGGKPRRVKRDDQGNLESIVGSGFYTDKGVWNPSGAGQTGGSGSVQAFFWSERHKKKGKKGKSLLSEAQRTFPIEAMPGVDFGGRLDTTAIAKLGQGLHTPVASPVELPTIDFDLDKGLVARGKVPKPSIKMLEAVEIDVFVSGDDIGLEATISAGELKLPGPFKVNGGALVLTASVEQGLKIEGRVDFEIEKLAKGYLQASAGTSEEFALDGKLEFDTKMFTKAELGVSYEKGKWGVTGELAVGPDKIKGIKKASAKVEVKDETVTADGEFETSIKGVDKGKVGFKYNEQTGMEITGEIILGKGIPGIKGGKLDAKVKEGADGWSLSGGVTVEPEVPGLSGTITGTYEDGAFLVEANLGYEKGRAKGSILIGVTNRTVDAAGKPTGPPKADGSLLAYGGGSVTLTITPWLQGTVGMVLKPNGEIEVSGEVKLPSSFDVFPEKKVEKKVFSIGIDIPIVGVAVMGQRIGIFATIRGGMTITAGFGPGQLKDVGLKVTYNPDRPDDTTVTGTGTFYVPAHAGLRLSVDGGLGVGIPIVSATAGVSIYGEVGLAGAASAAATIQWTPTTGIVLDAEGSIFVEPKFKFGIDAFVDVSADLLLTTIELYHKTWKLASFEYGSNLRFGLVFPLHYESGKPFEVSFDQIQWTYPQIDPGDLLGGLMKQLVG